MPAFFPGINCEIEINECDSSPCLHDGTCTDLVGRYECRCPTGMLYCVLTCRLLVILDFIPHML